LLLGRALGGAIGAVADYAAVAALVSVAAWTLWVEDDESEDVSALALKRGTALIALGIGLSLDELAMGFTMGLLHLSIVTALILIGAQAFVLAQLGMRFGGRMGCAIQERAELAAALALVGLALLVLTEKVAT